MAYHGYARATADMDVLVRAEPTNARRVFAAMAAFGAPLASLEVTADDLAAYDGVVQLGLPPNRIDILMRADGISFDEAVAEGDALNIDGRRVPVIGRQALLANKRASGRHKDLADVEALAAAGD